MNLPQSFSPDQPTPAPLAVMTPVNLSQGLPTIGNKEVDPSRRGYFSAAQGLHFSIGRKSSICKTQNNLCPDPLLNSSPCAIQNPYAIRPVWAFVQSLAAARPSPKLARWGNPRR
jgi:hypothetical protein